MKENKEKLILGLDLGITSIGWALVKTKDNNPHSIKDMGVRIIPLNPDETDEFTKGNAITKNQKRTQNRTQRKGLDRYQLRRKALLKKLSENEMLPDKHLLLRLSPLEIWGLRAKATQEKLSLQELGRVWLHLNQKRGYRHSKINQEEDAKQTEYVQTINDRHQALQKSNQTIGQYFYQELKKYFTAHSTPQEAAFRIKEKVYPRAAYLEEFDTIWEQQKQYYPIILTNEFYQQIRNEIIYYQRRLKSQKGLVSICEFEGKTLLNKEDKEIFVGPKVAPKSSPLFQVCKIWESINNITLKNRKGEYYQDLNLHLEELFEYLNNNEKLSQTELSKILKISKADGYFANLSISKKGIQGNTTKHLIANIIGQEHPALQFNLEQEVDTETGEIKPIISPKLEQEPLNRLWHYIYSLEETDCIRKLQAEFGFDEDTAQKLADIDFTTPGFGNKSAKAMRKILPHLQKGYMYSEACALAGYNHSNSINSEVNANRELKDKLSILPKNSLRQPVVEKILNQLINLTNAIIEKYGKPDEIRVELARELKQSREERNNTYKNINKRERENKAIADELLKHPEFRKKRVSRKDIDKYRLWEEFDRISPYEPTKIIGFGELFSGRYDIEHIIPRSVRFDDSFSNKTICKREFNSGESGKNNLTALDYMQQRRSKDDYEAYLIFIEKAFKNKKISKTKYENLLKKAEDLKNESFIDRNIRETQYISKKSTETLRQVCRNVYSTGGIITSHLRDVWGWDDILINLNFPKYDSLGLTEEVEILIGDQPHTLKRIIKDNWTKRDDHRHHAIDALTVACTKQGFIQRLNTLNAQSTRDEMYKEAKENNPFYKNNRGALENYLVKHRPFSTAEVQKQVEGTLISFKPGKKVVTSNNRIVKKGGKKIVVQKNILSPRGALSEESVYGKIKRKTTVSIKLDKNFADLENIIDPIIKEIIRARLTEYDNSAEKAFKNLKKNPIWQDDERKVAITSVEIQQWVEEFVIRYPLTSITEKDVKYIVDEKIREIVTRRLEEFGNNPKEAFKDLENNPVWLNTIKKIPIKSVRCYTNISAKSMATVKVQDKSWGIEYEKYLKPGNNHHVALYKDQNGKLQEHIVTFWHAVERKKYGIPAIIKHPENVWETILNHRELPQEFLSNLPETQWQYITSMQQNESFVFDMDEEDLKQAITNKNYSAIAPNIYRVRKLSSGQYWFNQQYETQPRESLTDKKAGRCKQTSLSTMSGIKVKINNIGEIFLAE